MFGGGNTQALLVQLAELTARVDAQEFNRRLRAANSREQDLVVEALQKEVRAVFYCDRCITQVLTYEP